MATFTVAELKDMSAVSRIAAWSDDKINMYQQTAEAVLNGLELDSSVSGYTEAYEATVLRLFDFFADNPIYLTSMSQGKLSKSYGTVLNLIKSLMGKFMAGADGTLTPAKFERMDIGRR